MYVHSRGLEKAFFCLFACKVQWVLCTYLQSGWDIGEKQKDAQWEGEYFHAMVFQLAVSSFSRFGFSFDYLRLALRDARVVAHRFITFVFIRYALSLSKTLFLWGSRNFILFRRFFSFIKARFSLKLDLIYTRLPSGR